MHLKKTTSYIKQILAVSLAVMGGFCLLPGKAHAGNLELIFQYEYSHIYKRGMDVFEEMRSIKKYADRSVYKFKPMVRYSTISSSGNRRKFEFSLEEYRDMGRYHFLREFHLALETGSPTFSMALNVEGKRKEALDAPHDLSSSNVIETKYAHEFSLVYAGGEGAVTLSLTNNRNDVDYMGNFDVGRYDNRYKFTVLYEKDNKTSRISNLFKYLKESKDSFLVHGFGPTTILNIAEASLTSDRLELYVTHNFTAREAVDVPAYDKNYYSGSHGLASLVKLTVYEAENTPGLLYFEHRNNLYWEDEESFAPVAKLSYGSINKTKSVATLPLGRTSYFKYEHVLSQQDTMSHLVDGSAIYEMTSTNNVEVVLLANDYTSLKGLSMQYNFSRTDDLEHLDVATYNANDLVSVQYSPGAYSNKKLDLTMGAKYQRRTQSNAASLVKPTGASEKLQTNLEWGIKKNLKLKLDKVKESVLDENEVSQFHKDKYTLNYSKKIGPFNFTTAYYYEYVSMLYQLELGNAANEKTTRSNTYAPSLLYRKKNFTLRSSYNWTLASTPAYKDSRRFRVETGYVIKDTALSYSHEITKFSEGDMILNYPEKSISSYDLSHVDKKTKNEYSIRYRILDTSRYTNSITDGLEIKLQIKVDYAL